MHDERPLADLFRRHYSGPDVRMCGDADLGAALTSQLDAGRGAWPGLAVRDGDFVIHLAQACSASALDVDEFMGRPRPDLYLACAGLKGCPLALGALDRLLQDLRARLLRGTFSEYDVDLIMEGMRDALLTPAPGQPAKLSAYTGRGTLPSWLWKVATNRLRDHRQRRGPDPDMLRANLAPAEGCAEAERRAIRHHHRSMREEALKRALEALPRLQKEALRLRVSEGLSLAEIADRFGVERSTPRHWLKKARESVLARARQHLRDAHGVAPQECDDILFMSSSQLDLSISRILAQEAPR